MLQNGFKENPYLENFDKHKSQQQFIEDASRKSSIDSHILKLVEAINQNKNYFTTSSCSGRFLAFSQVNLKYFKFNLKLYSFQN